MQTEKETILYISHHITKDNAICVYKFMRVGTEQTAYLLYTEGEMDWADNDALKKGNVLFYCKSLCPFSSKRYEYQ